MAKITKRSTVAGIYTLAGMPPLPFTARAPVTPSSEMHHALLLETGVFTDVGNGQVRYSGQMYYTDKNGGKVHIKQDGTIEYDLDDLLPKTANNIHKEVEDV